MTTNVFVSSLLVKAGVPAQALEHVACSTLRAGHYICDSGRNRATLNYDRIRRKYNLTDDDVEQLLALLQREALLVPGTADVTGAIPARPLR